MTDTEFERCIRLFRGSVCAAALCYLKNPADADDIVQDTFLKLYLYKGSFNDDEHIKAWLLRCAINASKNLLRSNWYRFSEPLTDMVIPETAPPDTQSLLPLIMKLGRNNRVTMYMYYYEGYSTVEIAQILGIDPSAVTSRLERGRKQLKKLLTEERNDGNDELQGYFQ